MQLKRSILYEICEMNSASTFLFLFEKTSSSCLSQKGGVTICEVLPVTAGYSIRKDGMIAEIWKSTDSQGSLVRIRFCDVTERSHCKSL